MSEERVIGNERRRHTAATIFIALGTLLAVSAVIAWWVGIRAEHVSNLVRPELTDEGLAQHREDYEAMSLALVGIRDDVLPAVAQSLGVTSADLQSQLAANYPDTARLLEEVDTIIPFAEQGVSNLERNQESFHSADDFPLPGLPSYALAILDLFLAAVLVAAGVVLWRGPAAGSRTGALLAAAVVAATLIALPLAIRVPAKTADAQVVLDSLNPAQAVVTKTETLLATTKGGLLEFENELLPGLAAALGTTSATLRSTIAAEFPDTAPALNDLPGLAARYEARVAIRSNGAEEIRRLKGIPVRELGWFGPAFGTLVALGTVAVFVFLKPRSGPDTY